MANIIWNYLGHSELILACKGLGATSKMLTYFSIGGCFCLILLCVHILTTLYEKYDEKSLSKVTSDIQLETIQVEPSPVACDKRRRFVKLQQDIELKFNQSSMNKTYAFPRKAE